MKIISFSWTTPAVKARQKSVTRREWDDAFARRFSGGELCQAYDKSPRAGGKPFGLVRILVRPYLEPSNEIPGDDWKKEGFEYLTAIGARVNGRTPADIWRQWTLAPVMLYVVRFDIVRIDG